MVYTRVGLIACQEISRTRYIEKKLVIRCRIIK